MSAVFKTKLRPRFIGPFMVVVKKGLAYTLKLPRKLRTHPVFYVGLIKSYRDPSHVNLEALVSRNLDFPLAAESESGGQAEPLFEFDQTLTRGHGLDPSPTPKHGLSSREAHTGYCPMSHEDATQFEKHLLRLLLRYTDQHRRCSMIKGTTSFMWRNA